MCNVYISAILTASNHYHLKRMLLWSFNFALLYPYFDFKTDCIEVYNIKFHEICRVQATLMHPDRQTDKYHFNDSATICQSELRWRWWWLLLLLTSSPPPSDTASIHVFWSSAPDHSRVFYF
jgi:hypothetical protein